MNLFQSFVPDFDNASPASPLHFITMVDFQRVTKMGELGCKSQVVHHPISFKKQGIHFFRK